MIRLNWQNGVFPSVALSNGLGWLAVRQGDPRQPGALVVYEWAGTDLDAAHEIRRWALIAGSPCFPQLAVWDGMLWLAYHDGARLHLRNLTSNTTDRLFLALSNPVAFGAGFFAYTEPNQPYRVIRLDLRTGEVTQPRTGAPTGLSRIIADGRIVTIDEDRLSLPGATIPSFAGPLAVGEGPNGGVRWLADGVEDMLWFPLDSFTPKCAADGARLAITTAGSGTVRLFCGSVEELHRASVPPAPPTPPDPVPQPQPEPHPMDDKPNYRSTVEQTRAHYPTPLGARHAAFLLELAHAIPTAGLLKKTGGTTITLPDSTTVSQDIICFPDGDIYDVLGDGENAATPGWSRANGGPLPDRYYAVSGGAVPTTPAGDTHRYDGGGNDTNECDVCHRSRFDPVHAIPESTARHGYDGGEQDTGLCDICQKPRAHALHQAVTTEPPPKDPPKDPPGIPTQGDVDAVLEVAFAVAQQVEALKVQIERVSALIADQHYTGTAKLFGQTVTFTLDPKA